MKSEKYNKLISQKSPYLQQHAYNPVDWYPWGDEAFDRAKSEQKPIIISIGYATCHWCHVMEHESFEDIEVAELMNSNFICIKVDREERPDLDNYYMEAVQRITQTGGWPLNCFALTDGRPFWGGTYFRKDSWIDLLKSIVKVYTQNYPQVVSQANELHRAFLKPLLNESDKEGKLFDSVNSIWDQWKERLDFEFGGEKSAPKFPMPSSLKALLDLHYYTNNDEIKKFLITTLDRIYRGGIFDQIGGGFSRYSTDIYWKIPHFEKMLYDNAQLIEVFCIAYMRFGEEWMKDAALSTVNFVIRDLKANDGGYFSAIDADSQGEEGAFYIWQSDEFEKSLGREASLFKEFYGIDSAGMWEGNKNILLKPLSDIDFCKIHQIDVLKFKLDLHEVNKKLLQARNKRERPITDIKRITSWNAMLLKAFAQAYAAFSIEWIKDESINLAKWLIEVQAKEIDSIPHTDTQDEGFLEDYAHLADAFLKMYDVFQDESYLNFAAEVLKETHRLFSMQGVLFSTTKSNSDRPSKGDVLDLVIPSANSVMYNNLYTFGRLTDSRILMEKVDAVLKALSSKLEHYPYVHSNWVSLALKASHKHYVAAIVGPAAKLLALKLNFSYNPDCLIASSVDDNSRIIHLKGKTNNDMTLIHMCSQSECLLPLETAEEVLHRLERR